VRQDGHVASVGEKHAKKVVQKPEWKRKILISRHGYDEKVLLCKPRGHMGELEVSLHSFITS
jgi:hypothetical protein